MSKRQREDDDDDDDGDDIVLPHNHTEDGGDDDDVNDAIERIVNERLTAYVRELLESFQDAKRRRIVVSERLGPFHMVDKDVVAKLWPRFFDREMPRRGSRVHVNEETCMFDIDVDSDWLRPDALGPDTPQRVMTLDRRSVGDLSSLEPQALSAGYATMRDILHRERMFVEGRADSAHLYHVMQSFP